MTKHLIGSLLLGMLAACGGGGGSTPAPTPLPVTYATKLTYTDPSAAGWRLARVGGTGTAADPLILELRGPASPRVKGAAFFLDLGAGSKAAWATLGTNTYLGDPGNLSLGAEPRLLKDRLTGSELQVGIFQKAGDADASLGVVRMALKLNAAQSVGDVILTQAGSKAVVVQADGSSLAPLTITLGTLKAE